MTSSTSMLLVITTCAAREDAERLARLLVEHRLAACVSIGASASSIYPWKGRVCRDEEWPLTVKTAPERLEALRQFFADHHPYDLPELLALPVVDGDAEYIEWARSWMKLDG